MNALAKAWVEALRSGEYQQTREVLSKRDAYCCMGVLCEVAIKLGVPVKKSMSNGVVRYDRKLCGVPKSVQSAAGLANDCGIFGSMGDSLTGRNDRGDSFSKIASLVESEPKGLFV